MVELNWSTPTDEKDPDAKGMIEKISHSFKYEDTTPETVSRTITALLKEGYDVGVNLKVKMPKD